MITTYKAAPDIDVLTSSFPVPGFGLIPINAFVLHAAEPVLIDTGAVVESEDFMTALRSVIDPADLRWIWLTHTDFDHIGSLHRLLAENPGCGSSPPSSGWASWACPRPCRWIGCIWSTPARRSGWATGPSPP